jgi:hypothetical protein
MPKILAPLFLRFTSVPDLPISPPMRPEITRAVDEIEQAIALLRRHL